MTTSNHEKGLARVKVETAEAELHKAEVKLGKADEKRADALYRRDVAEERVRQARSELAKLDWPKEPLGGTPIPGGEGDYQSYPPLVTFSRLLNGRGYTYAALGINGRWYLTGPITGPAATREAKSWAELMEFAGENGRRTLRVVTGSTPIGR